MRITNEQLWADGIDPESLTDGERMCLNDALANGEDLQDALVEYRYWRSPAGMREQYDY